MYARFGQFRRISRALHAITLYVLIPNEYVDIIEKGA